MLVALHGLRRDHVRAEVYLGVPPRLFGSLDGPRWLVFRYLRTCILAAEPPNGQPQFLSKDQHMRESGDPSIVESCFGPSGELRRVDADARGYVGEGTSRPSQPNQGLGHSHAEERQSFALAGRERLRLGHDQVLRAPFLAHLTVCLGGNTIKAMNRGAARLRELLDERGRGAQAHLAKTFGVGAELMSRWATGQRIPGTEHRARLEDELGIGWRLWDQEVSSVPANDTAPAAGTERT